MRAVSVTRGRGKAKDKGPSIHVMVIHNSYCSTASHTTRRANKSCSQYCKTVLESMTEYVQEIKVLIL